MVVVAMMKVTDGGCFDDDIDRWWLFMNIVTDGGCDDDSDRSWLL